MTAFKLKLPNGTYAVTIEDGDTLVVDFTGYTVMPKPVLPTKVGSVIAWTVNDPFERRVAVLQRANLWTLSKFRFNYTTAELENMLGSNEWKVLS